MRRVTLLADAPLCEKWFPKGTVFVVTERAKADAEPPQVDPRTADAWIAYRTAREGAVAPAAKGKTDAG